MAKSNIRYSIGEWQKKRNSYSAIMKSEVAKWNKPIYENIADLNEQISNKEEEVKQKIKELDNTQSQVIADQSRRAALIQQRDSLVNAHDETMKQGNHFIQNFEILEYAVGRKILIVPHVMVKEKSKRLTLQDTCKMYNVQLVMEQDI